MACRFAKVSEEEIEEAFFYPSDLVNTKTTIPLRVGEERWIYTSTLRVSVYIHHYSPPLRGIVVYYFFRWRNNAYGFLNKYLMFLKELNKLFQENWSKFLTAGYLVFLKHFPAAGYLDT